MQESINKGIKQYISTCAPNTIFSLNDFKNYSNYNNIKIILYRLEKQKIIKRLMDGLYYKPKIAKLVNVEVPLNPNSIAFKIAEKFNWKIVPEPNVALNALDLSNQIPMKYIFLSTGPYRKYTFDNTNIYFKHASEKNFLDFTMKERLVIQAIKGLTKKNINTATINKLRNFLTSEEKKDFIKKINGTTKWIYEVLLEVCNEDFSI